MSNKLYYAILLLSGIAAFAFFAGAPAGISSITLADRAIMGAAGFVAGVVAAMSTLGVLTGSFFPK